MSLISALRLLKERTLAICVDMRLQTLAVLRLSEGSLVAGICRSVLPVGAPCSCRECSV